MDKPIRGPVGGQQHLGGEAEIILRQRAGGCRIGDLGIDQPGGVGDSRPGGGRPGGQDQPARAPRRQAEFPRQFERTMGCRESRFAIGAKLVTYPGIVEPVGETVGMVEHLGQRNRLRVALHRPLRLAR